MQLAGQATRRYAARTSGDGYAMVALLVALSVMGIMASAAMPVWKQMAKREKEEEFLFRARQYTRAIELFQRKMPGALPPNLDVLVEQKFLRKKFKDPITNDDFVLIRPSTAIAAATPGSTVPGAPVQGNPARGAPGSGTGRASQGRPSAPPAGQPGTVIRGGSPSPGGVVEGIIGVSSKSKERSLRVYNGRTRYNEWIVQYVPRVQAPGAGAGGTARPGPAGPGGRGGRGAPAPPGPTGRPGPGPGRGRAGAPPVTRPPGL